MRTVALHETLLRSGRGWMACPMPVKKSSNSIMESPGDTGPACPGGGSRAASVTTTKAGCHSRIKHSLHLQHLSSLKTLLVFLESSKAKRPARSFLKVPGKRTKTPARSFCKAEDGELRQTSDCTQRQGRQIGQVACTYPEGWDRLGQGPGEPCVTSQGPRELQTLPHGEGIGHGQVLSVR